MSSTPRTVRPQSQGETPKTKVVEDFSGGVNFSTAREAIADNELWWCEGVMPIAPGNLTITPGPSAAIGSGAWTAETGAPSYTKAVNVLGADYIVAVWKNSGNCYAINPVGLGTLLVTGLTSGTTSVEQWNKQGILIVDPTGFWDYNVTTAFTTTALNNSVQSITVAPSGNNANDPGAGYTSSPGVGFSGGGGSGAVATAYIGMGNATIVAGGTGYAVGDVLTLPFTFPGGGEQMTLTVTTTNTAGAITGVKINTAGKGIQISAVAINALGGAGTGAQFTVGGIVTEIRVNNRGSGYTSVPTVTLTGGGFTRTAAATATVSGSLAGTAIAVYAGRVWIANGRTVTFTDAGSYASFIGSGSQFTMNDPWLHENINALFTANNYLYIFGDDSIDVLSNVTVTSAGTTNFSRVNVTASVGTKQPTSIFSYYRAICFANGSGFWTLSGATPELLSADKLANLIPRIDFTTVYGAPVTVANELCAAFLFTFQDVWFASGSNRMMLALYYRGKWFFARQARTNSLLTLTAMVAIPSSLGAGFYLYGFDTTPRLYKLLSDSTPPQAYWRVLTKLFKVTPPMLGVQAIRAGMGCQMDGTAPTRAGLTLTIDQETDSVSQYTYTPGQPTTLEAGSFAGYKMLYGTNNEGGGKYIGWGVTGISSTPAAVTQIQWLALDFSETNPW